MLQYLYTYEIFNNGLSTETSFQLCNLGDKYGLTEIRDTGFQNLAASISRLSGKDGGWAAQWYPRICQLNENGAQSLKTKFENRIAKYAATLIKNRAVREMVATNGPLAVILVEKLAISP